jgi:Pyridine nucleotide-disulphide oxidoreductase
MKQALTSSSFVRLVIATLGLLGTNHIHFLSFSSSSKVTVTAWLTSTPSCTKGSTPPTTNNPPNRRGRFGGSSSSQRMTTTDQSTSPTTTISTCYDLVVIGGGAAGLTAAKFATKTLKKSCLLIEQEGLDKLGGDCTWTGCVPSKSLLASAKAAHLLRTQTIRSGRSSSSSMEDEWKHIQQRFRNIQQEIYEKDDSPEALATKWGVETMEGTASVLSSHSVQVSSRSSTSRPTTIQAKEGIIICTGAKATPPESLVPGLETVNFVTYEDIWNLTELPTRLTVVGGGPVSYYY